MNEEKITRKLKASARKHYVRKKQFEALTKEMKRLAKRVAKLEKCCESTAAWSAEASTKVGKHEPTGSAAPGKAAVSKAKDKLTLIKGIGPVLEKKLNATGISSFAQIAGWSQKEIDAFSEQLNFKGRIEREKWVSQARKLRGK